MFFFFDEQHRLNGILGWEWEKGCNGTGGLSHPQPRAVAMGMSSNDWTVPARLAFSRVNDEVNASKTNAYEGLQSLADAVNLARKGFTKGNSSKTLCRRSGVGRVWNKIFCLFPTATPSMPLDGR